MAKGTRRRGGPDGRDWPHAYDEAVLETIRARGEQHGAWSKPSGDGYEAADQVTAPAHPQGRAGYDGTINPNRDGWMLPGA